MYNKTSYSVSIYDPRYMHMTPCNIDNICMSIANLGIQFQPNGDHIQTDTIQGPVNSSLSHFYSDIRSCSSPRNVQLGSLCRTHDV